MNKTKIDTQIKAETDSKKTITLKYMPELGVWITSSYIVY